MTNEQQAQLESEAEAGASEAARTQQDRHPYFRSEGGSFHIWWSNHPVVAALSEERMKDKGNRPRKGLWPFRTGRIHEAHAGGLIDGRPEPSGWESVDRLQNQRVWIAWSDAYRDERKIMDQEREQDDRRKLETYDDLLAALEEVKAMVTEPFDGVTSSLGRLDIIQDLCAKAIAKAGGAK